MHAHLLVLDDTFIVSEYQHWDKWLDEEGRNSLNPKISQVLYSLCYIHR